MNPETSSEAVAYRTRARCGKDTPIGSTKRAKQKEPARTSDPPPTRRRVQARRKSKRNDPVQAQSGEGPGTSELAILQHHDSEGEGEEVLSPGQRGTRPSQARARTTAPSPASSESDVVIVGEKQMEPRAEDDEEFCCIVSDERPQKRMRGGDGRAQAASAGKAGPASNGVAAAATEEDLEDDEDLRIVGETGQVATRDLPHPRPDCAAHRFKAGVWDTNCRHCDQCYCYICDVKASECEYWGTGRRDRDHANAHSGFSAYMQLRKAARAGDKSLLRQQFDDPGPLRSLPQPPRQQQHQMFVGLAGLGGLAVPGPPAPLLGFGNGGPHPHGGTLGGGAPGAMVRSVDAMLASLQMLLDSMGSAHGGGGGGGGGGRDERGGGSGAAGGSGAGGLPRAPSGLAPRPADSSGPQAAVGNPPRNTTSSSNDRSNNNNSRHNQRSLHHHRRHSRGHQPGAPQPQPHPQRGPPPPPGPPPAAPLHRGMLSFPPFVAPPARAPPAPPLHPALLQRPGSSSLDRTQPFGVPPPPPPAPPRALPPPPPPPPAWLRAGPPAPPHPPPSQLQSGNQQPGVPGQRGQPPRQGHGGGAREALRGGAVSGYSWPSGSVPK